MSEKIFSDEEVAELLEAHEQSSHGSASPEINARALEVAGRKIKLQINAVAIIRQQQASIRELREKAIPREDVQQVYTSIMGSGHVSGNNEFGYIRECFAKIGIKKQ
jgi:hypothetical protein